MPKIKQKREAILKPEYGIALIPVGPSGRDGFTIVDIEDAHLDEYFWSLDTNGYVSCCPVRGESRIYMHWLIKARTTAKPVIDHINRNILDNRSRNLRATTQQKNMLNKSGYRTMNGKPTTSEYKGVSLVNKKKGKPWQYALYKNRRRFYGYVATEKEAALEYNKLARKHHGKLAVLNEVEE